MYRLVDFRVGRLADFRVETKVHRDPPMIMAMMALIMMVTTLLFQENQVVIILFMLKFQKPALVATHNNIRATTPMSTRSVKYSTYARIIKHTIFFARTERYSIKNI